MSAHAFPRFEDWPTRLNAAIDAARRRPFDWRTHNCATFAADCVLAVTGEALHQRFAGLHKSRRSAQKFSADQASLRAEVSMRLDGIEMAPTLAQRGDVVLVEAAGAAVLGVCTGRDAACLGPQGVVFVPMGAALCAWGV